MITDIELAYKLLNTPKNNALKNIDMSIFNINYCNIQEMYESAVKNDVRNIKHVPEKYKSELLYYYAILQNFDLINEAIKKYPEFYNNYIHKIIEIKPIHIQCLNKDQQTIKLCNIALMNEHVNGYDYIISYIINPTKDMIMYSLLRNINSWFVIHDKFKTDELYYFFIDNFKDEIQNDFSKYFSIKYKYKYDIENGTSLNYIPSTYHDLEIINHAIKKDIFNYIHISNSSIDKIDILYSVLKDKRFEKCYDNMIYYINKEDLKKCFEKYPDIKNNQFINKLENNNKNTNPTQINIKLVLENCGLALKHIPEDKLTEELCLIAVKQDGLALEFVPDKFKTKNIIYYALLQNPLSCKFIPHKDNKVIC